jgi:hypothetical protein
VNPVLGGILGPPVTGGHKYRNLVPQVGDWMQGRRPCSVKKYTYIYFYEIQRSENRMQSGRIFYTGLRLNKCCFANDVDQINEGRNM